MLDKDFLFGTATSSYQIEGAWNEDGKTPSIWDEISHRKHKLFKIQNYHTGDIACDHYHRWEEDIHLLKELGVNTYRFSISWSRICTNENMCSNIKGIKFYQKLVKELIKNNIKPFVTLYHWDLPVWLNDIGGWSNSKSIEYFKCYAETMFNTLPEVKNWITFNEPAVFVNNYWGHNDFPKAVRNVLISHGEAVNSYKKNHAGKIGISLNLMPIFPNVYNSNDDIAVENVDKLHNRIWLDPIFKNGYFPEGINKLKGYKKNLLHFYRDEKEIVSSPIDFIGINYYTGVHLKYDQYNPPSYAQSVSSNEFNRDEMGTEIKPYGLLSICLKLKEQYGNPEMYITENGMACTDAFVHDNQIHDIERINYIKQHLRYCDQAIKNDCNLKGYFYWSLMDNFEWLYGYNKRFGLIYVFYPTQSRVFKDSAKWYQKIITDPNFRKKELDGKKYEIREEEKK